MLFTRFTSFTRPDQGVSCPLDAHKVVVVEDLAYLCVPSVPQMVQLQLTSSEKADKDDASPVTIADYGASRWPDSVLTTHVIESALVIQEGVLACNGSGIAWDHHSTEMPNAPFTT